MSKKNVAKKILLRKRRHTAIRKRVSGSEACPRVSVFRSNKEIYAQLVDDLNGKTLVSASTRDKELVSQLSEAGNRVEQSKLVGKALAERAAAKEITKVVFDRGGYAYHGRVKALAEGAREGGLKF